MASSFQLRHCASHRTAPRPHAQRQTVVPVVARFGGRDSNVLDRPDVDIKRSGWDSDKDLRLPSWLRPEADKGGNGADKQKSSPPGGGNYRVILLDSPQHTERGVVKGITAVVPGADESQAKNCFATSKQIGMAIVTSCLKEYAEMYCMQLYRFGLRTTLEPDNSAA